MNSGWQRRLKAYREKAGKTQSEVAEKCGITQPYYCKIERGRALPNIKVFIAICDSLDVSLDLVASGVDMGQSVSQKVYKKLSFLKEDQLKMIETLIDGFIKENEGIHD